MQVYTEVSVAFMSSYVKAIEEWENYSHKNYMT